MRSLFLIVFLLGAGQSATPQDLVYPPLGEAVEGNGASHATAELVAESAAIKPGSPLILGLRLEIEDGWHVYWKNPGDSGMKTRMAWDLPQGFTVGELMWPHPQRVSEGPYVTYAYKKETILLAEVTPPANLSTDEVVALKGHAEWLICKEICIPEEADVALRLPVVDADPVEDQRWAAAIAEASSRVPRPSPDWEVTAAPHGNGFMLRLSPLAGVESPGAESIEFFAEDENVIDHAAPQLVSRDGADLVISLEPSPYAASPPDVLRGVVLGEGGWALDGSHPALAIAAPIDGAAAVPLANVGEASSVVTLWLAIVFAFFGGMILNLMPCVFPVLSIKILGFVQSAGENQAVIRRHGWMFGAGVLISFLLLAGLLLALRAGGEELGWGFQLQSPGFVAAMAVLLFVLGLSLAGVFEIGTSLIRYAGEIGMSKGYGSSFWSGVLATVVATPCTAPFMGSALGFALSQPALSALSVFAVLGIGMATPYVLLSMSPGLVRRLPRPGAWMETFKELMAFPLFATVVWLVWVFGQQTGNDGVAYLLLALTMLSIAVWILGRWPHVTISPRFRIVTRSFALIATVAALWFVARGSSMQASAPGGPLIDGELTWNVYSEEAVQDARSSGRPVFIDFTAAWCLSCKVNESVALGNADVRARFQELDVVLFKADWTTRDPGITRALASFGRSGVPLYVLYSTDPQAPPSILPEIISPGIVLSALEELSPRTATGGRPGGPTVGHR